MRFGMEELRERALLALAEAVERTHQGPVDRTLALRFALAFLANFTDDRWPFDNYWRAIAGSLDNGRWQNANAALNAIRRAVGH